MSMSFSKFKKIIGADPWSRDAETLRARKSSPEFEEAAVEAEAFEKKLQSALLVSPPSDLLDNIKAISQQPARQHRWMPLALAASLLIAVGTVGMVWNQSLKPETVEAYLADHYSHDGSALITKAMASAAEQDINGILASLNAAADRPLADRIRLIKYCPTLEGRGAHMVVSTNQGPMTIIFMPKTQVDDLKMVEFDQMHALLVDLEHGSAAIIGAKSQTVENLEGVVRGALKTGLVGA